MARADLENLAKARRADQARWEKRLANEQRTLAQLTTHRTGGQIRPPMPTVPTTSRTTAPSSPRRQVPRPFGQPGFVGDTRPTPSTTRSPYRPVSAASFKGQKPPDSGGGGGGLWGNLRGAADLVWQVPVGMAALGVDVGKTAIDVPTELGQHAADLGGLAPWDSPDVFDPGDRQALGSIPRSLGDTAGRALEINDLLARGTERVTFNEQDLDAQDRRREMLGIQPTFRGGLADTQYAQAWDEGQIVPVLVEDVGNAALVAGGTGAALKGAGTAGRAGFRAGTRGRAVADAATEAGTRIRDQPLTGARGRREQRATRRADAMETLIGAGDAMLRQGNRLDAASMVPLTGPMRVAQRGARGAYTRLLDSGLRPGVVENPRGANPVMRTARHAAQSFEASRPMRYLAERGTRATRGTGAAYVNMRNIITGGDRSPAAVRAADDGMAAYLMLRAIPDPEVIAPGFGDTIRRTRSDAAARILQLKRSGQISREAVERINTSLKPLAEQVSRTIGQKVSPAAIGMYEAWRRGDNQELLARYDDAYRAIERGQNEVLESNNTDWVDPDALAVERQLRDQGIELDSVDPDVFAQLVQDYKAQRVAPLEQMYQTMGVAAPDPNLRLMDNSQLFSEAQRADAILPDRYNFELADTLEAERALLDPFTERQRLLGRRNRMQMSLLNRDPALAAATQNFEQARRVVDDTRAQFEENSPQVRAAMNDLTLRQQVLQDAISGGRDAQGLVTPGGRVLAGARKRQLAVDSLLRLYEQAGQATTTIRRDLQEMTDRFDAVLRDARTAPSRYRTAMHHVNGITEDLGRAANELDAIGLQSAANLIRQEAQGMPVYVADLIERSQGQDIRYVPGGRARLGSGGQSTDRLAGLRFRKTGQGDWTVAGQAAISGFRNAELVRREAEHWLANSPHAVNIQMVLGIDDTTHSNMSPSEIDRTMEERGYKLVRQSDRATIDPSTPYVPTPYRNAFDAYFNPPRTDTPMGRAIDKEQWVMQKWKRGVLGLSPRWLVGNIVGNALQAKVQAGVNFRDMPRLFRDSVALHYKLRGLTQENLTRGQELLVGKRRAADLDGLLGKWLEDGTMEQLASVFSHELRVNPELGDYALQRLMADARNRAMAANPNATLTQINSAAQNAVQAHLMSEFDGSADSWKRHPLKKFIDQSFAINTFVDDSVRGMVFLDQLGKRGGPANMTPRIAEQAVEASLRMIGNFDSMTAFEKRYIRQIFPFWSWMRHITQASARLPVNHPMRTAWYLHLATVGVPDDYYGEDVRTRGAFPLGENRFAPLGYFNPWTGSGVSQLWDTGEDDPISAALTMTAQNLTPVADWTAEGLFGVTIQDAGEGALFRPLTTDRSSLPYGPLGFQHDTMGLIPRALSGDVTPLLYRAAHYNPLTRATRDLAGDPTYKRYETGEQQRKDDELVPSGDSLLTPVARYTGYPLPPGDFLFDTQLDQERRLLAEEAALERQRARS